MATPPSWRDSCEVHRFRHWPIIAQSATGRVLVGMNYVGPAIGACVFVLIVSLVRERLAAHPDLGRMTGRFLDRCIIGPDVADQTLAQGFWAACEEMTGQRWSRQKGERVPFARQGPRIATSTMARRSSRRARRPTALRRPLVR
jgi:hypothetical protein